MFENNISSISYTEMAKLPSIKEFSQALPLLCAPEMGFTDEMRIVYKRLMCPTEMISIVPIVRQFCNSFFERISSNIEKYEQLFMQSEERFFKFMIPRCLILCEAPMPFCFILTCSFIVEFVYQILDRLGCYRYIATASKCINAVIERKFRIFFENEIKWDEICSYADHIMDDFYEKGSPPIVNFLLHEKELKDHVFGLIDRCNVITDTEFILSDYELELISKEDTIEENLERSTKRFKTEESLHEQSEMNYCVLSSNKNSRESKERLTRKLSKQTKYSTKASIFESQENEVFSTTSEPSFEEKYSGLSSGNDAKCNRKAKDLDTIDQDPRHFLKFIRLRNRVCNSCGLKCFKFLVLCIVRHRNTHGDSKDSANAFVELDETE